jgi:carboxypeptidase Taq
MQRATAYEELMRRTREAAVLESCSALLGWDEETYLPRRGAGLRGEQLALLAGLHHARTTHPRVGDLLAELDGSPLLSEPESPAAVNVRELRRAYERARRLPRSLVEELARVTAVAQMEWEAGRRDADFARFRPWLERVIALKQHEAEALGYAAAPYDALLDEHEPGARSASLAPLFADLCRALVPLAGALTQAPRRADPALLQRPFAPERQRVFGELVAAGVGFDFRRGRLDTAGHPFCTAIGPDDCRITTRYHPTRFAPALFTVLHEVGHGLYEQGIDPAHFGTPMGEAPSVGLHEAQARLWENAVGRSRPFWDYFFPVARSLFHEALGDVALDDFYRAVNHVELSPIRSSADEVTYDLHILIRFDLERALIAGDLRAADLPAAWQEAYQRHLGITPRDDAEGCLQDGHWASGLFGYFPTYTLGNLIAAQLFERARSDLGDLDADFAHGRFDDLVRWLQEKIYRPGHRYSTARLIEQATGSPPGPGAYVRALQRKYESLYGV